MTVVLICNIIFAYSQNSPDKIEGVKKIVIESKILNEDRVIYVYISENKNNNDLSVLYTLDGYRTDFFQKAINNLDSKQHIIIGIDTKENRTRDLSPTVIPSRSGSCGGEKFMKFLSNELIPYINKHYNTSNSNTFFGASLGGLFVIYTMLTNSVLFEKYISLSPPIGYCSDFMDDLLNTYNLSEKTTNKSLFLCFGSRQEMPQCKNYIPDFYTKLKKKLPNIEYKVYENEGHVPKSGMQDSFKFINLK